MAPLDCHRTGWRNHQFPREPDYCLLTHRNMFSHTPMHTHAQAPGHTYRSTHTCRHVHTKACVHTHPWAHTPMGTHMPTAMPRALAHPQYLGSGLVLQDVLRAITSPPFPLPCSSANARFLKILSGCAGQLENIYILCWASC